MIRKSFCISISLFFAIFCSSTFSRPEPLKDDLPKITHRANLRLISIPTGSISRTASFAYVDGSSSDKRVFAMNGLLIQHPRGDLLVDTGFGSSIDEQFAEMPWWFRALTRYEKSMSAAEKLKRSRYDFKKLRGILLTHAHWDHASGVSDFPGVNVLVPQAERRFIDDGGGVTRTIRAMKNIQYEEYSFAEKPYLGFARSLDFYGDGSIVIVPTPGHTPGSVVIFVNVSEKKRYILLGDLVWQKEGITLLRERPFLQRFAADDDAGRVRSQILMIAAIVKKFPEMILVPAHDIRSFSEFPEPEAILFGH